MCRGKKTGSPRLVKDRGLHSGEKWMSAPIISIIDRHGISFEGRLGESLLFTSESAAV